MPQKLSRQARRIDRLTRDPNGPLMKRIDVMVSRRHGLLFEEIRNYGNLIRQTAVERAIEAQHESMVANGTIPADGMAKKAVAE